LLGSGQILGLGDSGVDAMTCSFEDATAAVPYATTSSSHRKIAAYYSVGGDLGDSPIGHGTHIAATMVGQLLADEAQSLQVPVNQGMAPGARLVVVDVEKSNDPGVYKVPQSSIDNSYFDYFRNANANIVCSPWSYDQNLALQNKVDSYVWNHPTFLPVFPSGNVEAKNADKQVESPCTSKNSLCVGASYNAPRLYQEQPSFVHSALQLGSDSCMGDSRSSCAEEVDSLPALFGATKPSEQTLVLCESVADDCLKFRAACPECAYHPGKLLLAVDAPVSETSPADACTTLRGFPRGQVCLVQRGTCSFLLKAKHCSDAGAVGVLIVNGLADDMAIMTGDHSEIQQYGLILPVMMVSHSDGPRLLQIGARVTFPVISQKVKPQGQAPYSRHGPLSSGRLKPDVVLPGDGITSTSVGAACSFKQMSGTSQSCGLAAGAAGLVREYLSEWADLTSARLGEVWASSIKATLVAAADLDRSSVSSPSTVMLPEVGFGLPTLAAFLPIPAAPGLVAIQSSSAGVSQQFCLELAPLTDVSMTLVLAWTDPPSTDGALVHDLDLEVLCDVSSWTVTLGNAGSSPDRLNNVEKVLLLGHESFGTGLCIARVNAYKGVSAQAPQPFSLVASGFQLAQCAAPVRVIDCGNYGTSARIDTKWTCQCVWPYLGPFCDQQAQEVPLHLDMTSPVRAEELFPWQWSFFTMEVTCGAGQYQLLIEQPDHRGNLLSHVSWGHLHTTLLETLPAVPGVTVTKGNIFELQNGGQRMTIVVDIQENILNELKSIFIALQWQGRSSQARTQLRWSAEGLSCGISTVPVAMEASPGELVLLICGVVLGIAAVIVAAVVILKSFRGREKVLPREPSRHDVEQAECIHTANQQWHFES